jgi:hypothetical protein
VIGSKIGRWCPARQAMEVDRQVGRALRGGTTAMRAMGTVFLPRDWRERQKPEEYQARLLRTFLTPGYDDAIKSIASRPFQRAVELKGGEKLAEELQKIEKDSDRKGLPLTMLAHDLFEMAIDCGVAHVLIEYPDNTIIDKEAPPPKRGAKPTRRVMNSGEAMDNDIRPYFCKVHPDNLVNWAWKKDDGGRDVLAFVAIYESRQAVDPVTMDVTRIDRIRYWSDTEWQVWERAGLPEQQTTNRITAEADLIQTARQAGAWFGGEDATRIYTMVSSGTHPVGRVPLVSTNLHPFGADPLQARPWLIDLAWKNIEHWQVSSGRSTVLFYAGCPLLTGSGAKNDDAEGGVTLGAGALVMSNNPDFKMAYVEPGGSSFDALQKRDAELKEEMARLGHQPLVQVEGPVTATGEVRADQAQQSPAQSAVEKLEWLIYQAYEIAARWEQGPTAKLPEEFDVAIFRDFGILSSRATDIPALQADAKEGRITTERYLTEARFRGLYRSDMDPAIEAEKAAESLPNMLPSFGQPPGVPGSPDGAATGAAA